MSDENRSIWIVDPKVVESLGAPVIEKRLVEKDYEIHTEGRVKEFRSRKPALKYAMSFLNKDAIKELAASAVADADDIEDDEVDVFEDEELPKKGIRKLYVVEDRNTGQIPIIAEHTVEDKGEDMRAYRGLFDNKPKFRSRQEAVEHCLTDIRRNIRRERKVLNEFMRRVA